MNRLKSLQFKERTGIISVLSLDCTSKENAILSSIGSFVAMREDY